MDAFLFKKDVEAVAPVCAISFEPDGGLSRWLRRVAAPPDAGCRKPVSRWRAPERVRRYVLHQPVEAFLIALTLGFIGGVVWARR